MLAYTSTLWLIVALSVVAGLGGGAINLILGAIQYERIPPALLARVLGRSRPAPGSASRSDRS